MLELAMPSRDPRINAYIASSAEFARPILTLLRQVVHTACPEVEETIKWGMPFFMHHGILCHMAAFKQHVAFGIWRGRSVVAGSHDRSEDAMGNFGRITKLADLPPKRVLAGYIRKAAALREAKPAAKAAPRPRPKPPVKVPADLAAALGKNARARKSFDGFSPSHRREYVEWITEAKREETRARRLQQAVEWLAEGKPRNWKYTKC
jgi:uncharacterized protein YdeI (YjbR/CyaY-like superfamily)